MRARAPIARPPQFPQGEAAGEEEAVEGVLPVRERDEQEQHPRRPDQPGPPLAQGAQQAEGEERDPGDRGEVDLPEREVVDLVGVGGEDQPPGERGQPVRHDVVDEPVGVEPGQRRQQQQRRQHRRRRVEDQLQRHAEGRRPEAEGVEVEADPLGVVEGAGEVRRGVQIEQRLLRPPDVPDVLPAVDLLAGDDPADLEAEGERHDQRRDQIAEQHRRREGPPAEATGAPGRRSRHGTPPANRPFPRWRPCRQNRPPLLRSIALA